MEYRTEKDSIGEIKVPADKLWGAQTERSYENFKIGEYKMPKEVIDAILLIKKCAAIANFELGVISQEKKNAIVEAVDTILKNGDYSNFPLVVFQTGSGTQTNMNCNEVIANLVNFNRREKLLHPNDDVNKSQSSNDVFPSAMCISAVKKIKELLFTLKEFINTLEKLEKDNLGVVKCGRTHMQDAVPIGFYQEISGWKSALTHDMENIKATLSGLYELALGGTAVGTGINAPKGFSEKAVDIINKETNENFTCSPNKFYSLSFKDNFTFSHGAINALSCDMIKIANDIRVMSSGPRCGFNEITIPQNEPGSSIMPGKVNPTQVEALTMVGARIMGNDTVLSFSSSQGNFELNTYMPVIIFTFLESVTLLKDAIRSFNIHCVSGIKANREKMKKNLNDSLMNATVLNTVIGYEKVATIVKKAYAEGLGIKEACLSLGYMTEEEFDNAFHPENTIK